MAENHSGKAMINKLFLNLTPASTHGKNIFKKIRKAIIPDLMQKMKEKEIL
jgi:hypothetical protein